jgi:hypothetical protein
MQMLFQDAVALVQQKFPIKIQYKDQSWFMKLLGSLLFFNPQFMTSFTTTIGNTTYYPSENYVKIHPITAFTILLHESIHVYDSKKITNLLFTLGYLFPQILVLLFIPLFLLGYFVPALCTLLFLAPIPAYFRMLFEKRAYMVSLYSLNKVNLKYNLGIDLNTHIGTVFDNFKGSTYYFMWPFKSLEKEFNDAVQKIKNNERPFNDPVFDLLDEILEQY